MRRRKGSKKSSKRGVETRNGSVRGGGSKRGLCTSREGWRRGSSNSEREEEERGKKKGGKCGNVMRERKKGEGKRQTM